VSNDEGSGHVAAPASDASSSLVAGGVGRVKQDAIVRITPYHVEVLCRLDWTRLPFESDKDRAAQISSAVFVHEQECGHCNVRAAYARVERLAL
jgi:hypothetical protein